MEVNKLEAISGRNLSKFRTNLDAIIAKYNHPFDESCHDVIDLQNLSICSDRGQLRRQSYKSKIFGKANLATDDRLDLTAFIEDRAISTCQHNATLAEFNSSLVPDLKLRFENTLLGPPEEQFSFLLDQNFGIENDVLCELWKDDREPSDAETLSDSDSSESEEETTDDRSSISSRNELSDDVEKVSCQPVTELESDLKPDLLTGSRFHVQDKLQSTEFNILKKHTKDSVSTSETPVSGQRYRVIAEPASSPTIILNHNDSRKSGFDLENYIHLMHKNIMKRDLASKSHETTVLENVAISNVKNGLDGDRHVQEASKNKTNKAEESIFENFSNRTRQNKASPVKLSSSMNDLYVSQRHISIGKEVVSSENEENGNPSGLHTVGCSSSAFDDSKHLNNTYVVLPQEGSSFLKSYFNKPNTPLRNNISVTESAIVRRCHKMNLSESDNLTLSNQSSNLSSLAGSLMSDTEAVSAVASGTNNQVVKYGSLQSMHDDLLSPKRSCHKSQHSLPEKFYNQHLKTSQSKRSVLPLKDQPLSTSVNFSYCYSMTSPIFSQTKSPCFLPLDNINRSDGKLLPNPITHPQLPEVRIMKKVFEELACVKPKLNPRYVSPSGLSKLEGNSQLNTNFSHTNVVCCYASSSSSSLVESNCKSLLFSNAGITWPDLAVKSNYVLSASDKQKPFCFNGVNSMVPSVQNLTDLDLDDRLNMNQTACRKNKSVTFHPAKVTQKATAVIDLQKMPSQQTGRVHLESLQVSSQTDLTSMNSSSKWLYQSKKTSHDFSEKHVEKTCESSKELRFQQPIRLTKLSNKIPSAEQSKTTAEQVFCCEQQHGKSFQNVSSEKAGNGMMRENALGKDQQSGDDGIDGPKRSSSYKLKFDCKYQQGKPLTQSSMKGKLNNLNNNLSDADDDDDCCVSLLGLHDMDEVIENAEPETDDGFNVKIVRVTNTPTELGPHAVFDASFLSSISDASDIAKIKKFAIEAAFAEDELDETVIQNDMTLAPVAKNLAFREETTLLPYKQVQKTNNNSFSNCDFNIRQSSQKLNGTKSPAKLRKIVKYDNTDDPVIKKPSETDNELPAFGMKALRPKFVEKTRASYKSKRKVTRSGKWY